MNLDFAEFSPIFVVLAHSIIDQNVKHQDINSRLSEIHVLKRDQQLSNYLSAKLVTGSLYRKQ